MNCVHCEERIELGEEAECVNPLHRPCLFRMASGSVAHQLRKCSCFVRDSDEPHEPVGVTKRQAAELALAIYRNGGRLPAGELTELYLAGLTKRPEELVN